MKRWAFNVAAGVSLLLLGVAFVQWCRGYHVQDAWSITRIVGTSQDLVHQYVGVTSCQGALWIGATSSWTYEPDREEDRVAWRKRLGRGWSMHFNVFSNPVYPDFKTGTIHRLGFHASRNVLGSTREGNRAINIVIPTWFVAVCTAITPTAWLFKYRAQRRTIRRLAEGLCLACGYDLRATPDRCPECGAVAGKASDV